MKEQYTETHPQMAAELDESSIQPEDVPATTATAGISGGVAVSDDGGGTKKKTISKKPGTVKNANAMPV